MGEEAESTVLANGDEGSLSTPPLTVETNAMDDTTATTNKVDTAAATTTTTTTPTTPTPTTPSNNPSPAELFAPGDHVIRWEMLPIAWPIQIHGIVLCVSTSTVVMVDFGLTAAPQDNTATTSITSTTSTMEAQSPTAGAASETRATTTPEQEASSTTPTKKKPSIFSSDPKEMEAARKELMEKSTASSKKILQSFQKLHPQTKKRLNVLVLEDPAEWKKWKKVNYESSFFGFGKNNNNNNNTATASDDGRDPAASEETAQGEETNSTWWNKMKFGHKKASSSNLSQISDDDTATETKTESSSSGWFRKPILTTTTTTTTSSALPHSDSGVSIASTTTSPTDAAASNSNNNKESSSAKQFWNKLINPSTTKDATATAQPVSPTANGTSNATLGVVGGDHREPKEASNATNVDQGNQSPPQFEMEMEDEEEIDNKSQKPKVPQLELEPEESPDTAPSDAEEKKSPTAFMNPAMARLMESKKEDQQKQETTRKSLFASTSFFGKAKSKDTTTTTTSEPPKDVRPKKRLDLPKADPPKLVLARTRWLLQHGEAVLPPYHAFHSNSECIAVFCKTGYWSNLQADVFLHSTAIGNAKTMGAATLGVAASAPFLAPVIAGLGIGMVAAPWLILHSSKQQADDITLRMTDQFWAQAEPEVFVECIEHWSKLEDYYKRLEAQKQDTPRIVAL